VLNLLPIIKKTKIVEPLFGSIYHNLIKFITKRGFFDKIFNEIFAANAFKIGGTYTFKGLDKGLLESLGPSGIVTTINKGSFLITTPQTGLIYHYALMLLVGTSFLLWFCL